MREIFYDRGMVSMEAWKIGSHQLHQININSSLSRPLDMHHEASVIYHLLSICFQIIFWYLITDSNAFQTTGDSTLLSCLCNSYFLVSAHFLSCMFVCLGKSLIKSQQIKQNTIQFEITFKTFICFESDSHWATCCWWSARHPTFRSLKGWWRHLLELKHFLAHHS